MCMYLTKYKKKYPMQPPTQYHYCHQRGPLQIWSSLFICKERGATGHYRQVNRLWEAGASLGDLRALSNTDHVPMCPLSLDALKSRSLMTPLKVSSLPRCHSPSS